MELSIVALIAFVAIGSFIWSQRRIGEPPSVWTGVALPDDRAAVAERLQQRIQPDEACREKFHEKAIREAVAEADPKSQYRELLREHFAEQNGAHPDHDAADAEFQRIIAENVPESAQQKAFYVTVAGTSHRNPDRSSRARIIDKCEVFDSLRLLPEPDNQFDPNAIAVCRWESGEQLGYLDARLAGEISRDQAKHGPRWVAFFRHKNRHPETNKVVGASLYMVRLTDEYIAQREAESPGSVIGASA